MQNAARRLGLGGSFALLALTVGCGSKQPCKTDPTQVEALRAEATAAAAELSSAERDLAAAQARKSELDKQIAAMGDDAALRARLEILKKGSGR